MQNCYEYVKIFYKGYTKPFQALNQLEVYTMKMKRYLVSTVLVLSLVVGLLLSTPAKASAKTVNCSNVGTQIIKVGIGDSDKIANLFNKIKLNIDSNWIKSLLDKYINSEVPEPEQEPKEEVKPPAEAPEKPETPEQSETPEKPEVPEKPETPEEPKTPEQAQLPEQPQTPKQPEAPSGLTAEQARMLELVNQERAKAGLNALKWDAEVARVANIKAQDMVQNNYFSHTSPTYGSPFDMMKSFGISYRTAGENLAGYNSVEGAHNGLMNSDGHRANILNPNFTHIGIGVQKSPRYGYVFVQMFIGR